MNFVRNFTSLPVLFVYPLLGSKSAGAFEQQECSGEEASGGCDEKNDGVAVGGLYLWGRSGSVVAALGAALSVSGK